MFAPRPLLTLPAFALLALATPALAGGPLTSGAVAAGSLSGPSYTESWTIDATAGDRLVVVAVTTSGLVNTSILLRAPGGTTLVNTSADRVDVQATNSGTYSLDISDVGLNDAGTYNLMVMNITAGPLTEAGDLDGGAIASGDVLAGGIGGVADLDAFTFSGNAGDRLLFGVLEGSGAPFNAALTLFPPGGGGALYSTGGINRIDIQLPSTGTYTVVVEDLGDDDPGNYTVSMLDVTSGPLTTLADPDGGPTASATKVTGAINGVIDWDAWTFSATNGDRIAIVDQATSGSLNTTTYLYPPGGGSPIVNTSADRFDVQLTATGTWTVVVEDVGFGDTGDYALTVLDLTSGPLTTGGDPDGGPIASGEVKTGTADLTDMDAFTFSGTAGDRVLFGVLEGTPSPFNAALTLYPPGGGAQVVATGGTNRIDYQLAATGTYTVVVEDVGNDNAGSYTVSLLNVTSGPHTTVDDPDGSPIASSTSVTGTMNGAIDWDAFTFTGTIGDRVAIVDLATGGSLNTNTYLYPPGGGQTIVSTSADRFDAQLTATGTWTIVVEDVGFGDTGTYRLSLLNLTAGPYTGGGEADGGAIASGEVKTGTIGEPTDLDGWTFSGVSGERVLLGVLEGTASPFNCTLTLYPPGGGSQVFGTGGANRVDYQLAATGTYTLVVEDVGDNDTGDYTLSYLNVTGGPHATLLDPDGGPIVSAERVTGTMNTVVDWDAFTFTGNAGDRVVVADIPTGGSVNPTAYLYPPGGGSTIISSSADRWDVQLTQSGTWTLVIEDQAFGDTGDYALTLLDITSGPLTTGGDPDGGPIGSDEHRVASIGTAPDLDAYTFSGTAGDRVVFGVVEGSPAPFNATLALFPPGGGSQVQNSGGTNRIDYQLLATGTYTVVVEDLGDLHSGDYSAAFVNVTSGPVTSGGDPDGGWLASGSSHTGDIAPVPDFDVYWFDAQPGDTAKVSCVTLSGTLNTTTRLYPPGGGAAVVNTSTDTWTYPIVASGRHALMVQHIDLTQTGTYQLGLTGPLTSVDVPIGTRVLPAELALSAARPNPSRSAVSLSLDLPRGARVRWGIYDLRGARVRGWEERAFEPGVHALDWDGADGDGRRVASGIYFARVLVDGRVLTRRIARMN